MIPVLRWLAASLLVLVAADVRAQGLGDTAARERQKRKAENKPAKVYDNDDLQKGRPPGQKTSEQGAKEAAPAPAARPSDEPDPEEAAAQEKRALVERAQADLEASEAKVAALEARIKALEDSLNPMSPSFVYGASTIGMSAPGGELRARDELQAAQKQLVEARQAVEAARKALDEARSDRRVRG